MSTPLVVAGGNAMIRNKCICGTPLRDPQVDDAARFSFVPSSSLAHVNYEVPMDDAVTLTGGRVFEQCPSCGALVFCPYPQSPNGPGRDHDPIVTYGPGTVYEQCDIASVPAIYLSFRGLMSSGVTGGVMYSGVLRDNLAGLFHVDAQNLPTWKTVKDALVDGANVVLDEWWFAAIGRNFIVLYENVKVLRPVAAWHRVAGTENKNPDIDAVRTQYRESWDQSASDMMEVAQYRAELEIPDERRKLLVQGNKGRMRLLDGCVHVGRALVDVTQWAPQTALQEGASLSAHGGVRQLDETAFGIWHGEVDDPSRTEGMQVDVLIRHNAVAKMTCSCESAQQRHICRHMTAVIYEMGKRMQVNMAVDRPARPRHNDVHMHTNAPTQSDRYRHYADAFTLIHGRKSSEPRYRWLTQYIEPFEHPAQPLYHIEFMPIDGMSRREMGFCIYSNTVLSLIEDVINNKCEYAKVFQHHGLDTSVSLSILNIDAMDGDLLEALVIVLVRREKRKEGSIAEALESGMLIRMLRRLRDLDQTL